MSISRPIKEVSTADLIPYANNSRTHDDIQVSQIAASIKEFGFLNPVIVDGDNGIIAGHGRVMAANKLGIKELPCVDASHLSEAQKKAYIIADNKLALNAGWDDAILRVEFEAWQQALAYEKSNQTISISVHVLKTLKEFKKGFDELNPRAESQSKAFKDMYVRIVSNAKLMGDVQAFTDPVGALKAPKEDERRITTCPPELMAQMKGINKNSNAGRA